MEDKREPEILWPEGECEGRWEEGGHRWEPGGWGSPDWCYYCNQEWPTILTESSSEATLGAPTEEVEAHKK